MATTKKSVPKTAKAAKADQAVKAAKVEVKKARTEALKAKAERIKAQGSHLGGFMNFVREQGVVGLAVGLAIGTAAGASVKVIVDQLIAPIVALMTRGVDLNSLKFVITAADPAKNQPEVAIGYGLIISSLITLAATALVVYLVIHFAKLDRLDKKKD